MNQLTQIALTTAVGSGLVSGAIAFLDTAVFTRRRWRFDAFAQEVVEEALEARRGYVHLPSFQIAIERQSSALRLVFYDRFNDPDQDQTNARIANDWDFRVGSTVTAEETKRRIHIADGIDLEVLAGRKLNVNDASMSYLFMRATGNMRFPNKPYDAQHVRAVVDTYTSAISPRP